MKKTYYPVAGAWLGTFFLLGINFLIRRDVFPHWVTDYVLQLLVPLILLVVVVTQALVFCRSLYFLLEKPNKKESFVKFLLSFAWLMGTFIPGISLRFPGTTAPASTSPTVPAQTESADVPPNLSDRP